MSRYIHYILKKKNNYLIITSNDRMNQNIILISISLLNLIKLILDIYYFIKLIEGILNLI